MELLCSPSSSPQVLRLPTATRNAAGDLASGRASTASTPQTPSHSSRSSRKWARAGQSATYLAGARVSMANRIRPPSCSRPTTATSTLRVSCTRRRS
ncbi:hypothetical protein EXIGLDRAFT_846712 [Exidia glandulosa HHB12029]|uniref:Uncharacterized protein n=1 Tax=Exidia glandulosa HHB12029 TaxID=1314781 RepID=A0A166NK81_EXIGL|nr:hypothetical protein EXIGLDRAFT_846712 [Exidia glandulosa HHB12029]